VAPPLPKKKAPLQPPKTKVAALPQPKKTAPSPKKKKKATTKAAAAKAKAASTLIGRDGTHIRLGPQYSPLLEFRELVISPVFRQPKPWLLCSSSVTTSGKNSPL
jgi:hypothetical protein